MNATNDNAASAVIAAIVEDTGAPATVEGGLLLEGRRIAHAVTRGLVAETGTVFVPDALTPALAGCGGRMALEEIDGEWIAHALDLGHALLFAHGEAGSWANLVSIGERIAGASIGGEDGLRLARGTASVLAMKADPDVAASVVTGVTSVVLWTEVGQAIMRLTVSPDAPLTMGQLVRAVQCGYLVSAQTACRWGQYQGLVPEHVAAGCRISTGNMPHEVEYRPTGKLALCDGMALAGHEAVLLEDGQLDIRLKLGASMADAA